MKYSILADKSFRFSLRIVKLYKYLIITQREYVLSKQILRSGTSVGANIEEALGGQSIKDFFTKLSISYKEARETNYWLKILKESDYLTENQFQSISQDCVELIKIITAIQIKIKKKYF